MAYDLVFFTNPQSRGRIVRWMLEEVGVSYRTEILDYATTMKAPDYLAINPMGKVPALSHGPVVVTECAAICAYLADAFPDAGLAPPLDRRGAYYRWLFFGAGPFEASITNEALKVEVPPDRRRMVGYGSFADVVDALDGALAGAPYVAGEQFTAADVYVGSMIGYGFQLDFLERRPAFVDYWSRIGERPARLRAQALDDALIPPPTE